MSLFDIYHEANPDGPFVENLDIEVSPGIGDIVALNATDHYRVVRRLLVPQGTGHPNGDNIMLFVSRVGED